jgi:hypothetical protein
LGGGVEEIVDTQGGCCDNDVHEIFKCMEETVLKKAFVHQNDDSTFTTFGCNATLENDVVKVCDVANAEEFVYSLNGTYKVEINSAMYELCGFGIFEI